MSKAKAKSSSGYSRVKDYSAAIRKAYNSGYRDGYRAHANLPNVRGASTAAKCGYNRGISAAKKVEKYRRKAGSDR